MIPSIDDITLLQVTTKFLVWATSRASIDPQQLRKSVVGAVQVEVYGSPGELTLGPRRMHSPGPGRWAQK